MPKEMQVFAQPTDAQSAAERAEDWAFGFLILGLLIIGVSALVSGYEIAEWFFVPSAAGF